MVQAKHVLIWKKYILLYKCIQKQGKKNFWNRTLGFQAATYLAPTGRPVKLDLLVHVSSALKRTMEEFKNLSSHGFGYQSCSKYIFSRKMPPHFWAWIHGVLHNIWIAPKLIFKPLSCWGKIVDSLFVAYVCQKRKFYVPLSISNYLWEKTRMAPLVVRKEILILVLTWLIP